MASFCNYENHILPAEPYARTLAYHLQLVSSRLLESSAPIYAQPARFCDEKRFKWRATASQMASAFNRTRERTRDSSTERSLDRELLFNKGSLLEVSIRMPRKLLRKLTHGESYLLCHFDAASSRQPTRQPTREPGPPMRSVAYANSEM